MPHVVLHKGQSYSYKMGGSGTSPVTGGSPTWHKILDFAINSNYPHSVGTGVGPISKFVYQGFAGEPTWDSTSRYVTLPTQEGQVGIMRVDTTASAAITGIWCNNDIYSNPSRADQHGGVFIAVDNFGGAFQALDPTTLNALPGWPVAPPGDGFTCRTDGTWAFFPVGTNPGTIWCVKISAPATTFTVTAGIAENWTVNANPVFNSDIDTTARVFTCVANGSNNVYVVDFSPLYASGGPSVPLVKSVFATVGGSHSVAVSGANLYTMDQSGLVIAYNISNLSSPVSSFSANLCPSESDGICSPVLVDRAHGLLYTFWDGKNNPSFVGCNTIGASSFSSVSGSPFAGYRQGSSGVTFEVLGASISPDGNRLAIGASQRGTESAPGGCRIWDISALHTGGSASVIQDIFCNSEPSGNFIPPAGSDTSNYVYNLDHYQQSTSLNDGTHYSILADGLDKSRCYRRIGVTSGSDPNGLIGPCTTTNHVLLIGAPQGSNDEIWSAYNGAWTLQATIGDTTISDAYWDGKYLWTLPNAYGWQAVNRNTVTWSASGGWVITLQHQYYPNIYIGGSSQAIAVSSGSFDANTCQIVAAWGSGNGYSTQGVYFLSWSDSDVVTQIGYDPVYSTVAQPSTQYVTGGSYPYLDSPFTYWFQVAYYTASGTFFASTPAFSTGVSGLSVSGATSEIILTDFPSPPAGASILTIGGGYEYGTGVTYPGSGVGFSPIPGLGGLPLTVDQASLGKPSVVISIPKETWFGNMPTLGDCFPTGGTCMNIVVAGSGANTRVYMPWGDNGLRIYNPSTNMLTNTIPYSGGTGSNLYLRSGSLAVSNQGGIIWVISNNYGAQGGTGGTGLTIFNTTSNPDNPPITWFDSNLAFTCGSEDTAGPGGLGLIWLGTLEGIYAFQYS